MITSLKCNKIRFLQISEYAGSSLNRNIFKELCLIFTHIASFDKEREAIKGNIPPKSTAHQLACNSPFLPGHISYTDLKRLKRDFIFTVIRNPRERCFNHYTYNVKRASISSKNKQFEFYLTKPLKELKLLSNRIVKALMIDIPNYSAYTHYLKGPAPRKLPSGLKRLVKE